MQNDKSTDRTWRCECGRAFAVYDAYSLHRSRCGNRKPVSDSTIPEGALVRLKIQMADWPAGTRGTVVHRYCGGAGYEVEFSRPGATDVLTVRPGDIETSTHQELICPATNESCRWFACAPDRCLAI